VKKVVWMSLAALLAVAVIVLVVVRRKGGPEVSFREVTVERGDLNVEIVSTGTVQPQNRLEIKPPIAGRVERVLAQEGQEVRRGQVLAWMSSTERAALLDAARAKGPQELARWEELYRATPILAPIKGSIILRNVESGQTFTNADSVFVMSDRLTVKAQVDETDIAQVKTGQSAKIVLDAYASESIPAKVDKIAYDAKTVNNVTTYTVDVVPAESPAFMRSGMTANVSFLVEERKGVLVVPSEALRFEGVRAFVQVPGADPRKPNEVAVETGATDGKRTEVKGGLNEGDRVLIREAQNLSGGGKSNSNPFMPRVPPRSTGGRSGTGGGGGSRR
jgi:macrolide-specific efflux system membrane fusion protein